MSRYGKGGTMRSLKFRAWHEADKCWYNPRFIEMNLLGQAMLRGNEGLFEIIPASAIEQYTGLKDKNGTEIYEGDICKDQRGHVGKIVWVPNEAGFGFYEYHVRDDGFGFGFGFGCMPLSRLRLEIIGNIHKNGELLEGRK